MRSIGILMITVCLSVAVVATSGSAEEAEELAITEIERVRWSGLSLDFLWYKWRMIGSWSKAPRGIVWFGSSSPYFRVNGDDQTIFRGLGREKSSTQYILPTLQSRENLRQILYSNERARQSLVKFDEQVAAGEDLNMISTFLVVGGKTGMITGTALMILGLGPALKAPEGDLTVMIIGYRVAILSSYAWFSGKIGQIVSNLLAKQSFAHLHDAMDYYNADLR